MNIKSLMRFLILCSALFLTIITIGCTDDRPQLKPLDQSATILAFGDSLTFGTGASKEESYPVILKKLIGTKVINAGIPGEISEKGKNRLGRLLKKHQPDLVILCHGGNDLLQRMDTEQTIDNLKIMIKMIREHHAQVVLLSVPKPGILLRPAPFYQDIADEMEVPITMGVLSEIISDNKLKSDAVHPNGKGYFQMAKSVAELLVERKAIKSLQL